MKLAGRHGWEGKRDGVVMVQAEVALGISDIRYTNNEHPNDQTFFDWSNPTSASATVNQMALRSRKIKRWSRAKVETKALRKNNSSIHTVGGVGIDGGDGICHFVVPSFTGNRNLSHFFENFNQNDHGLSNHMYD